MDSHNQKSANLVALIAPLEVRLKRLDDTKRKLRELFERADNALSLEKVRFCENYVEGHLIIVLDFNYHIGGKCHHIYCSIAADHTIFHSKTHSAIGASCHQLGNGNNARRKYESMVFISNVEFVEPPEGVSVPSFVRLQRFDEVKDFGAGTLYFSMKVGFKVIPFLEKGKSTFSGDGSFANSDKLTGQVIESGSQIMDRVTSNGHNVGGERDFEISLYQDLSGVRVFLNDNLVRVILDERVQHRVQLNDVLIGPFDLQEAT